MHMEVQVALNFIISYLYNKLPRRRVNIFGEELEKALKDKFQGHWYPEKPFKGSAFRCLKTGDPVDPVLERAAKESGVPIQDILENLPAELAVWVDPGEVSYRIGETSQIKILYSENTDPHDESSADREVTKTFNPEAQCFRPIEAVGSSLSGLSLSPKSISPFSNHQGPMALGNSSSNSSSSSSSSSSIISNGCGQQSQAQQQPQHSQQQPPPPQVQQAQQQPQQQSQQPQQNGHVSGSSSAPSPTPLAGSFKGSPSPVPAFIPRSTAPLTFTTATFAQTKFGSTKLKSSSKRVNRMSPTEFSNYIKQRAMQQQIHHHHHQQQQHHQQPQPQPGVQGPPTPGGLPVSQSSPNSRSLSPGGGLVNGHNQHAAAVAADPGAYFFHQAPPPSAPYHPQFPLRNIFDSASSHNGYLAPTATDLYAGAKFPSSYFDPGTIGHQFYGGVGNAGSPQSPSNNLGPIGSGSSVVVGSSGASVGGPTQQQQQQQQSAADKANLVDGLNNFGLGSVTPYPASNYQHLLVAN
ncbi:protein Tob1 isoform X1 [Copidosoma floridanum]|uniref:protein Tob1 isoform X1 n=1 Tax=Copidosoma floridanum TaxID=29053 RepID=UPI0006C95BCE|nr:protein Tob1 isoform X1 [Copidosoma floridanum]XP_014206217.1 protein Tob1 isoform X1 [Copidosoma floridanum]XP_014206218.1 protein Tob1 isoform X1 [Copidosoma floridanum]